MAGKSSFSPYSVQRGCCRWFELKKTTIFSVINSTKGRFLHFQRAIKQGLSNSGEDNQVSKPINSAHQSRKFRKLLPTYCLLSMPPSPRKWIKCKYCKLGILSHRLQQPIQDAGSHLIHRLAKVNKTDSLFQSALVYH